MGHLIRFCTIIVRNFGEIWLSPTVRTAIFSDSPRQTDCNRGIFNAKSLSWMYNCSGFPKTQKRAMISALRHFFDTYLTPESETEEAMQRRTRMAVAVLLLEIAASDFAEAPEERQEINRVVQEQFGLSPREASDLVTHAKAEHSASTDYFQFTRLINQHYSMAQKIGLVESLWRVAFADRKLDRYEEHVIRRLTDLLHVSHKDFIAAKHRVMSANGQA